MTTEEIKDRIRKIKERKGDDEMQHSDEDDLYSDFIRYVAEVGPHELAKKANLVLATKRLKFARWCA